MNIKKTLITLTLPVMVYGCGGGGGGSSTDTDFDDVINTGADPIVQADEEVVESTAIVNVGGVSSEDIYDPSNSLRNICSAPFYEELQGTYTGTFSVQDRSDRHCSWEMEVVIERFYDNPLLGTGLCNLDVTYTGTGSQLEPLPVILANDVQEINEREQRTCIDFTVTAEILGPGFEPDLSNLNFPIAERARFDRTISILGGDGIRAAVLPNPSDSEEASSADFLFIGNNQLTLPETQLIEPIWTGILTKQISDLGLPVE